MISSTDLHFGTKFSLTISMVNYLILYTLSTTQPKQAKTKKNIRGSLFISEVGLRQSDNLSALLLAIYLKDFELFFYQNITMVFTLSVSMKIILLTFTYLHLAICGRHYYYGGIKTRSTNCPWCKFLIL